MKKKLPTLTAEEVEQGRALVRETGYFSSGVVMRKMKITYSKSLVLRKLLREEGQLDDEGRIK